MIFFYPRQIFRSDELCPRFQPFNFVLTETGELLQLAISHNNGRVFVQNSHARRGALKNGAVVRLAFEQGVLHLFAVTDVYEALEQISASPERNFAH